MMYLERYAQDGWLPPVSKLNKKCVIAHVRRLLLPLRFVLWFAVLITIPGLPDAKAQEIRVGVSQYSHTAWRVQDGIFPGHVQAITQTTDGYLWIGTSAGLFRFDGSTFAEWQDPKGKRPAGEVQSLIGAADGSLWIGSDWDLWHIKDGQVTPVKSPQGRFNRFLRDQTGKLWAVRSRVTGDDGPLCAIDGLEIQCHGKLEGARCKFSSALTQDPSGTIWFSAGTSLCTYKPGTSSENFEVDEQGVMGIGALMAMGDGSLLVGHYSAGADRGLRRFFAGKSTTFRMPGLDGEKISTTTLKRDSKGGVWLGTLEDGLYHIEGGRVDHFGAADGLSGADVKDIFEDSEGDIWIATGGGVDEFHKTQVVSFGAKQGLTSEGMVSVLSSRTGAVYAGSDNGLQVLRDGQNSALVQKDGLPGQMATSVAEDREGNLWIGVNSGLVKYSHGHFTAITRPEGKPFGPIDLAIDSEDLLWILSVRNKQEQLWRVGKDLHVTGVPIPFSGNHYLYSNNVGNLWLYGKGGDILRRRGDSFEAIPAPPTLPWINGLVVDATNALWAAADNGLYRWRDHRWAGLSSKQGLPCDNVEAVAKDRSGAIWLNTRCGLLRLTPDELERWWQHPDYHPQFRLFRSLDGARPGWTIFNPQNAVSEGGQIWFANNSGLLMVDPAHLEFNSIPPPVHIQELLADHISFPVNAPIALPALTHDIAISYAGLSFKVLREVHFRYKLSGVDKDWQDVDGRRQAFYMNLRPGSYRFQVIACNNDGIWNMTGDQLSFVIRPAFYQTVWFRALGVCVTLLSLWIIFRLRLRSATAQIESRLGERLMERDRIARELHDTLLQGFQALLLQLQTAIRRIPESIPERESALLTLDRGDEILLEGRDRVRDLRSHETTSGPLVEMLEKNVSQLQSLGGPQLHLTVDGQRQAVGLLVAEELSLFAREALSNAVRHSRATQIHCELHFYSRSLLLVILDNGVGIPQEQLEPHRNNGHWGVQGMRERAKKIDGKMNVQTGTSGTRFELRVPARVAYQQTEKSLMRKIKSLRPR